MEPTPNKASAKITTALIIGLLVGFTAGMFWQERRSGSLLLNNASTKTSQNGDDGNLMPISTSTAHTRKAGEVPAKGLIVKDQPASDRVEIENLDAMEILWVAVREEKDGVLGNILGAQKVLVGDGQKVIVELLRPTVSGGAYRVVLHSDAGDPAFNYREDVALAGVEAKFTAQ
ncbi:MAG TPA: hypothetical protein DEF00_05015 [Candidatus Taylorbacteria bacterium]|nr:MAG: hypothetical protein UY03_C0038G0002 [Parcubacteria group bacterium GW2011_GWA2_47_64]KKU95378.1 MAG: hypothetical protein UY29_C0029G0002 [Parcubacteria group bacterium GW2011_GWC2_48_17]HBV01708.1 hypothetical protein [Candidatus Taylorbacteria bacterium]